MTDKVPFLFLKYTGLESAWKVLYFYWGSEKVCIFLSTTGLDWLFS